MINYATYDYDDTIMKRGSFTSHLYVYEFYIY